MEKKIINSSYFSVYQRFASTYKSIDVCSLSVKQRTLLCNEAFRKDEVPQKGEEKKEEELLFNEDSKSICMKNKVKLSAIDADDLETNLFSMWECNGNIQTTQNMYFLGKNHLKNAATIYARIRIRAEDYFYPHIIIAGINKYGLVKDEIEKKPVEDRTGDEITSEIE